MGSMAISDGLGHGSLPNEEPGIGALQPTVGIGTERQDNRSAHGKGADGPARLLPVDLEFGREEISAQQIAELPATRNMGGGSEIWFPPTQIKKMLHDHLRSASRPCKICYHDLLKDAPNPGLSVKGFGPISFPFLERDIERIIETSKRSEIEKGVQEGSATKSIWVVPSDMLELKNPSWNHLIERVLGRVGIGLEIDHTGRGVLTTKPTLILHEPNGAVHVMKPLFPKSPVFGYLDITLPSKYTGGNICVEHDGRTEAISFKENSEYDCSCLAWFSNVVMSSSPISAGHRLVLRYTLEHKQPGLICSAIPLAQEMLKLQSILTSWTKQKDQVTHEVLGYILNDKYEDRQLDKITLSDSDELAVVQLTNACAEAGLFLCLSNLSARIVSRKETENSRRSWQANCPVSSFKLGRIVDFKGKELLGNYHMDFKEDDLVQDRTFDGGDYVIDEESENYDNCVIKLFRKTVVIILPLEDSVSFFYGVAAPDYNGRVKDFLAQFCSNVEAANQFTNPNLQIGEICKSIMSTVSWDPEREQFVAGGYSIEVQFYALKAIQILEDEALLARACPIGFANSANYEVLHAAASAFGSNWLQSNLSRQMAETKDFLSRCIAIGKIEKWLPNTTWVTSQYEAAMDALEFTTEREIEEVIKVATLWARDLRLQTILIPAIKKILKGNELVLTLLSQLSVEKQVSDSVFKELMPQSIEHFVIERSHTYFQQIMSNILLHCHNLGLSCLLEQVVTKISNAALRAAPLQLENEYLSFLGRLAGIIDKTTCLILPIIQGFYQHVINLIISQCVPIRENFVLRPCGCGCGECNALDTFLLDGIVKTAVFQRDAHQLDHLTHRLRLGHPDTVKMSTNSGTKFPYSLQVSKIGGPVDNSRHHWTKKHELLINSITQIGTKRLRYLLEHHYATLMSLKIIPFNLVILNTNPAAIDSTFRDNLPSSNQPILASHAVLGSNVGPQSISPIPSIVPRHPAPTQNSSPAKTPPSASWSAINHTPSHSNPSEIIPRPNSESAHSHLTAGRDTSSIRRTASPAIAAQNPSRSTPIHHSPLQITYTTSNIQDLIHSPQPREAVVKTETGASLSRQNIVTQRPVGLGTPVTASSMSTSSSRTLPPPSHSEKHPNGALELSLKRKESPISAQVISRARRPRLEDPSHIPGGVWGSIDAPIPPIPDGYVTPPPPDWLISSLAALRPKFSDHLFKAIMCHFPVSTVTDMPCSDPDPRQPLPSHIKYMWVPRIQCEDCPAKLYIPGSQRSVTNFVFHLKNQMHTSNVQKRLHNTSR